MSDSFHLLRRRVACAAPVGLLLTLAALLTTGCETKPAPNRSSDTAAKSTAAATEKPAPSRARSAPASAPTHVEQTSAEFLKQPAGTLRLLDYNINWDHIFVDVDAETAEKFARVVRALKPDIIALQELNREAADVAELMNAILPLPDGQTWHAYKGKTNVTVARFPLTMTRNETVPPTERELCIALIDLPDNEYNVDLYLLNNHFKCCGGTENDPIRQKQADALVNWLRDARTPGGEIDLPPNTPFILCGDFNIVGGQQPLMTVIEGDIQDETTYGTDSLPDWDDTPLTDLRPKHNLVDAADYTWRDDAQPYPPGRLDYVVYSDSVIKPAHSFILDTMNMSDAALKEAGLQRFDVALDNAGVKVDHYPLVFDFEIAAPARARPGA